MQKIKSIILLLICCGLLAMGYIVLKHFSNINLPRERPVRQTEKLQITSLPKQYDFRDITVLPNGEILALGFEGQYSPRIWQSKDGGQNWEVKTTPNDQLLLDKIYFTDQKHGWVVGVYNYLYRTTDGGMTWEQLIVPTKADLKVVHFINPNVGYVAGSTATKDRKNNRVEHGLEILRTTNGGKSWQSCYKSSDADYVFGISAISEKIAIASIEGNSLIRTEDGGITWQVVALGSWSFLSIVSNSNGFSWAVGRNTFYRTIDQGKTWQIPDGLPQSFLSRHWKFIEFANDKRGIALTEDGVIALTNDGGTTWTESDSKVDDRFLKVRLTANGGIILGHKGAYRFKFFGSVAKFI